MSAALDPEVQRVANLRRRVAMLARHAAATGRDGKSTIAVAAGSLGGRRTVARHESGTLWGLRLALWRWHQIPILSAADRRAEITGKEEDIERSNERAGARIRRRHAGDSGGDARAEAAGE